MEKIKLIYQKQKEYGYIKSISIFRNIEGEICSKYNIEMLLTKFPCWDEEEYFKIVFEGISNLKLGDIDNLLQVSMQIQLVAEYQRENEKYYITECENELFSFSCKKIKV